MTSGFAQIIGQDRPIAILQTFLRAGNWPHAMLFCGISGIGKRTCARLFAMACNCEHRQRPGGASAQSERVAGTVPCGKCRSCRKILSENHPDVLCIAPQGTSLVPAIKIRQIRELIEILALKPYEARVRVAIIADAQHMNPEAANALLKVLEEPPEKTLLILTAPQPADLLPTIVSRCQPVRFNPIGDADLERHLIEDHGVDPDIAVSLCAMAGGSLSKALHMNHPQWIEMRRRLIEDMMALENRPVSLLMALAERLALEKKDIMDILEIMTTWLRDLLVFQIAPQRILNRDLGARLRSKAMGMKPDALLVKLDAVHAARKQIQANANLRLTLENLMLHLAEQ